MSSMLAATNASSCVAGCTPALTSAPEALRLYTEGDALYDAMLAAIRSAVRSVRFETYILAADELGWEFAKALAERAHSGVEVRVQVDAAGSLSWRIASLGRYLSNHGQTSTNSVE